MIRKQVYLTEDLNRRLDELSKARGVPQSEVIREGLEQYLVTIEDKDKLWNELIEDMKQSKHNDLTWDRDSLYRGRSKEWHDESSN